MENFIWFSLHKGWDKKLHPFLKLPRALYCVIWM